MGEFLEKSERLGVGWGRIGCGVMVVLVGVAIFLPGRRSAGPAAKAIQTVNNLKNVGLAGMNFEREKGELVLEESNEHVVLSSWGTQLLPYLDREDLFSRVDQTKSWDDEWNREVFREEIRVYFDWTQPRELMRVGGEGGYGAISFSANVHVMGAGGVRKSDEITDGLSQTILFGTIRPPFPAWGKPGNFRDPALGLNRDPLGFGADHRKGVPMVFADGSVRVMDPGTDVEVMRGVGTPRGGVGIGN